MGKSQKLKKESAGRQCDVDLWLGILSPAAARSEFYHAVHTQYAEQPLVCAFDNRVPSQGKCHVDTVHRRVFNPFSNLLSLTSPRGGQRWLQGVLRPRLLALQPCVLFDEDPLHKMAQGDAGYLNTGVLSYVWGFGRVLEPRDLRRGRWKWLPSRNSASTRLSSGRELPSRLKYHTRWPVQSQVMTIDFPSRRASICVLLAGSRYLQMDSELCCYLTTCQVLSPTNALFRNRASNHGQHH